MEIIDSECQKNRNRQTGRPLEGITDMLQIIVRALIMTVIYGFLTGGGEVNAIRMSHDKRRRKKKMYFFPYIRSVETAMNID